MDVQEARLGGPLFLPSVLNKPDSSKYSLLFLSHNNFVTHFLADFSALICTRLYLKSKFPHRLHPGQLSSLKLVR